MTAAQVLDVLAALEAAGVTAWVDGGWGVDALLGEQTREHDDLDLVLATADVTEAVGLLTARHFVVERDWLPTAIALRHEDGRAVDLHPVRRTDDGGGDQVLPDGGSFHYDKPVTGSIAGETVRCCGPETQLAAHLGYEPEQDDVADVSRLARRFDLPLPAPYSPD